MWSNSTLLYRAKSIEENNERKKDIGIIDWEKLFIDSLTPNNAVYIDSLILMFKQPSKQYFQKLLFWQPIFTSMTSNLAVTQVFSCEICEIFRNTWFYRTPPVAVSFANRNNTLIFLFPKLFILPPSFFFVWMNLTLKCP